MTCHTRFVCAQTNIGSADLSSRRLKLMGSHALDAKLATVEHSRRRSAPLRSYVLGAQHTATKRRARQRLRSPRAGDGEALQPRSSPCSFAPIIAFVARQLAIYLHRAVPGGFASLYRCVGSTCMTTGRAPDTGERGFFDLAAYANAGSLRTRGGDAWARGVSSTGRAAGSVIGTARALASSCAIIRKSASARKK